MSRRLIIFGTLAVVGGWVIYFAWPKSGEQATGSRGREMDGLSEGGRRALSELATDALVTHTVPEAKAAESALPTDVESWRRAVENYSQADADAFIERTHMQVAAANVFQAVEWSPLGAADRQRLKDSLMKKELAGADLARAMALHGMKKRKREFDTWVDVEHERIDREVLRLVGPEYFGAMKTMRLSYGVIALGVPLMGEVYLRGMSLSDAQIEAMNQVTGTLNLVEWSGPADPSTGLTAFDVKFLAAMEQTLTPEQWDCFRRMRIQGNLYQAALELKEQRRLQERAQR